MLLLAAGAVSPALDLISAEHHQILLVVADLE